LPVFRQGQVPLRRHATDAPDAKTNTDQVRRWREVFNEGAETPGAKSRGL
jgi:hypothetical protein